MKSIERIKVRWKIIQIMYLIKVLENIDIDLIHVEIIRIKQIQVSRLSKT